MNEYVFIHTFWSWFKTLLTYCISFWCSYYWCQKMSQQSKRTVTLLNQEKLQDCLNKTSVDFQFPLLSVAISTWSFICLEHLMLQENMFLCQDPGDFWPSSLVYFALNGEVPALMKYPSFSDFLPLLLSFLLMIGWMAALPKDTPIS